MVLDLRDVAFTGPAMPEPFVRYKLEDLLTKKKLLARESKSDLRELKERWVVYRRKLRALGEQGGEFRVLKHVIEPLIERLGYKELIPSDKVTTREGAESGGFLLNTGDGARQLRVWTVPAGTDLDAPNRRGRAYRFSPALVAQRVLLTKGERVGLLTDGLELRIVLSDPSGRDSNLSIRLDRSDGWRGHSEPPDSYRLLRALCQPDALAHIPDLLDEARLSQSGVTKKLREQARRAVERFIQGLLDAPENHAQRTEWTNLDATAKQLWHEGLILVYRLLFILKLETAADPARAFSFATVSTWRNSYSPSTALAEVVEKVRDQGAETGGFLAASLRALFRLFSEGVSSSDLQVNPLGGVLFGKEATPLLDSLTWSEQAVAELLDALLWTMPDAKRRPRTDGTEAGRERVHYGALDVEDLGRVYEALLELEPGVTAEPMARLRRAKLEVVVPLEQAVAYRKSTPTDNDDEEEQATEDGDGNEDDGVKTKVVFIEEIPTHRFFLRVGLGRKSSGSYYTPHPFVRFLVQETLGPQIAERSPQENPSPAAILDLKVLDPAMGSGHFLVEACRFLGEALYEACRLCDEHALEARHRAEITKHADERQRLERHALDLWKRVEDLPDPNDELLAYLPSRVADGQESGLSQRKALALCRRLVAVHCLYGVDKNPLAVELARVSLWLESFAEGLPLTFLEHRLLHGDSLSGPFFEHLFTFPGTGQPVEELHSRGIEERLRLVLASALGHVRDLEASIGKDIADLELKRIAKLKLDTALEPLRALSAVWSGGVMLGSDSDDAGYEQLLAAVVRGQSPHELIAQRPGLRRMLTAGTEAIAYDLVFPEVFHPEGRLEREGGFSAVLGNPPWDAIKFNTKEFLAAFDLRILAAPTKRERDRIEQELTNTRNIGPVFREHQEDFERQKRANDRLYAHQKVFIDGDLAGRQLDAFRVFAERAAQTTGPHGAVGMVFPSAFHANAGATGIRQLYLKELHLEHCYSFENRRKLFEIDSRFKFAPTVARRTSGTSLKTACAFYVADPEWLFGERNDLLYYDIDFIERAGGDYLTLPELRSRLDLDLTQRALQGVPFGEACTHWGIRLQKQPTTLDMTKDAHFFTPAPAVTREDTRDPSTATALRAQGYLPLHEGKTFHQFDDRWGEPPRYLVALNSITEKPDWQSGAQFYRAAFRDIASATNERTGIFCILPPGVLCGNKAPCERSPRDRPNAHALCLVGAANTFVFDFMLRTKVQATVNLFILNGCPLPRLKKAHQQFLAHSTLRLTCNHDGYRTLWNEQVGEAWRELSASHTWPVVLGDNSRWALRAAIDATVAHAYGLNRAQYEHALRSFSHSTYGDAPFHCLAAFDEFTALGFDAFAKKHDPYWDIPLVTTPAQPAIEFNGGAQAVGEFRLVTQDARTPSAGRKKMRRA